jgi:hypothetical protein
MPVPHRRGKGYDTASYQRSPISWWKQWGTGSVEFWGSGEVAGDGHNPFNPHPANASQRDLGPPYYEDWTFASVNSGWLATNDPDRKVLGQAAAARYPTDMVMTDVIGFDVKVWDPGAPLFRYRIAGSARERAQNVVLVPGDPGYAQAAGINFENSQNPQVTRVGHGAFVDLGYLPDNAVWVRVNNRRVSSFVLRNPPGMPLPHFNNIFAWDRSEYAGFYKTAAMQLTRVYDTWSTHYDADPVLRHVVWSNYWEVARRIAKAGGSYAVPFMLSDPTNGMDDLTDPDAVPNAKTRYNYRGTGADGLREKLFRPPYPQPMNC